MAELASSADGIYTSQDIFNRIGTVTKPATGNLGYDLD